MSFMKPKLPTPTTPANPAITAGEGDPVGDQLIQGPQGQNQLINTSAIGLKKKAGSVKRTATGGS